MKLASPFVLLACSVAVLSNPAAAIPIDGEMNLSRSMTARAAALDFGDGTAEGTGGFVTIRGETGYLNAIASISLATPYLGMAGERPHAPAEPGSERRERPNPPDSAGIALPTPRNRADAPIPEPASALLLLVGSLILGKALRRAE